MKCPKCGAENPEGARFCSGCGLSFEPVYAGFWRRFLATIIDGIILGILYGIISKIFVSNVVVSPESGNFIDLSGNLLTINLITAIIFLIYYSAFESSRLQATPGKRVLSLVVTKADGQPISFFQALVRNFCKYISAIILFIGFLMAAFTAKKQALHDLIAGTLVLKKAV